MPNIVLLRSSCLLLSLLLLAASLSGQSAAERRSLAALRDSLANVTDTVELRRSEAALIVQAKRNRDDPMVHLRLGLLALRLGELGQRKSFDDAGSEFQWAIELRPRWPWGWFGLGLAELGVGDSELSLVAGLQSMLGKDALTRSATAFAKSSEVDPGFVEGVVELANTALQQRVNIRTEVALAALRRTGRTAAAAHPEVLLARGRIERAAGSVDSAIVALRALHARDRERALSRYELGRTLLLQDDPDGAELWYAGLAASDGDVLARYRRDLDYLLPPDRLDSIMKAAPAERVAALREEWLSRDLKELRPEGARLGEHYRRLEFAERHYRLTSALRIYDIAERHRSRQDLVDDRGVIYIRHGPPDEQVSYTAPEIDPNESWRYWRDDGDLVLHFVARDDVQDFRLVESAFDVLGFATTVALRQGDTRMVEFQHLDGIIRVHDQFDPVYRRLLGAGRGSTAEFLTEERALGQRGIAIGTTTDSWPLRFEEELPASLVTVAAGAEAEHPVVQLAFRLRPESRQDTARVGGGGGADSLRLRAVVMSIAGQPVAKLDTVMPIPPPEPAGDRLGRLALEVPAGIFLVRAAVETAAGGELTSWDTLRVASPFAVAPTISELVLGTQRVPLSWQPAASADSIWLNPSDSFHRTDPLEVYLEVAGVQPRAPYKLEVTVRRPGGRSFLQRLFRGSGAAIKFTVEAEHPGGVLGVRRQFRLDRLDPGAYQIDVRLRVEGEEGEILRTRQFEVLQ